MSEARLVAQSKLNLTTYQKCLVISKKEEGFCCEYGVLYVWMCGRISHTAPRTDSRQAHFSSSSPIFIIRRSRWHIFTWHPGFITIRASVTDVTVPFISPPSPPVWKNLTWHLKSVSGGLGSKEETLNKWLREKDGWSVRGWPVHVYSCERGRSHLPASLCWFIPPKLSKTSKQHYLSRNWKQLRVRVCVFLYMLYIEQHDSHFTRKVRTFLGS